MSRLLVWLTNQPFFSYLLLKVVPYIRFTTYYTTLRGWKYHRGYQLLRPGHIIVSSDKKKLTTLLVGGEWCHAALCVGLRSQGAEYEIAEMTHTNYTRSDFFDICKEADRVAILECRDFDPNYVNLVIARCLEFQGAQYDVQFSLGVQALYCSELVYQSDFEHRLQASLTDIAGLGRPYISPTGLFNAKNVRVIWDSDAEKQ